MSIDHEKRIGIYPPSQARISQAVLNEVLEDPPFHQRLTENIDATDIVIVSSGDPLTTHLIEYSAFVTANLYTQKPEKRKVTNNMYHIGAFLMCNLRNEQHKPEKPKPLSKYDLPAFIEGIFPTDGDLDNYQKPEIIDHNTSLQHYFDGRRNYDDHINFFETIRGEIMVPFVKQQQKRRREFLIQEKNLAYLTEDQNFLALSPIEQQAFLSGIIDTYFLFKVRNELENLRSLWKNS